MNRRDLLSAAVRLAGVPVLAASRPVAETAGYAIGTVVSRGPPAPTSINRTAIEAAVTDASSTSVTVRFRADAPVDPFVPVLSRRRFPDGTVLAETTGPRIDPSVGVDRQVTISIADARGRSLDDPWAYQVDARTPGDSSDRYLCESDPEPNGSFRERGDATAPLETDDDDRFERRDREGRYEVRFRWTDGDRTQWTLDHAVSKSAFGRARRRRRGYARTSLESRTNPHAAHLTERLVADAVPVYRSDEAGDPTEAALFDRVVRFVQSFRYAADEDSMGTYDYHRTVEESLVDGACDCKDGTYLLAGLLAQPPFEYETALVAMADHLFLGVHTDDLPPPYAGRETVGDSPYVGIETTKSRTVGRYGDDPIVAIVGPSFQSIDADASVGAIGTQLERLAAYYG